jgi:hypothetical protein
MASTRIIKIVFEIELTEEDDIASPVAPEDLDEADSTSEEKADRVHAQTLLTALRANPALHAEFVKILAIYSLDIVGMNQGFANLANLRDIYSASLEVLRAVVPQLPPAARAHYQQLLQDGHLSEGTQPLYEALQFTPLRLLVE